MTWRTDRRGALRGLALGGGAALLGWSDGTAAAEPDLDREESATLDTLAATIAVFPVTAPFAPPRNSHPNQPTTARTAIASRRVGPRRRREARHGLRLVRSVAGDRHPETIAKRIGGRYARGSTADRAAITAAMALALSSIRPHFDPGDNAAARLWLDFASRLNRS